MGKSYEIIVRLTNPDLPASQRREALKRFADENEWLPSDEIDEYPGTEQYANGHLVVEHGLENTAVITFLKRNQPFSQLDYQQKLRLLSISYNNLVEWHSFPDERGLTLVYNRVKSMKEGTKYISINEDEDVWRAEAFDRITGKRPNPNVKSLDNALIETISWWKRALASELGTSVQNENISALFNSLIFARALEDYRRRNRPNETRLLVEKWLSNANRLKTIRSCIKSCIRTLGTGSIPSKILDEEKIKVFDALSRDTVLSLFRDFYINKFARYHYDFSLMSKHALSRIYEHYVSLLNRIELPQMTFFPDLPEEVADRTYGGIYTPQYIARFFARYLKENLTPILFRRLRCTDPACGSGIFLRTILEMQCDPLQEIDMREPTRQAFSNVLGVDIDENACQAARLSLYLLHLILTDTFPTSLKIINANSIDYFRRHNELANSYDAVIANPPFVKWENISSDDQQKLTQFMEEYSEGKVDLYLAFLKLGMELLKEGGYLLYVLPHSFLIADNAQKLRKKISVEYSVRSIVDLSEIDVFEGIGSYVILLIIQKKRQEDVSKQNAIIVRCRRFPGYALQTVLEGKRISTDLYQIYEVDQESFVSEQWQILTSRQASLKTKLSKHPTLDNFLTIRVGFSTGANKIFIRKLSDIPKNEKMAYIPYLQDREMQKYNVPTKTQKLVFYPYIKCKKIKEGDLKTNYPETWEYLKKHRHSLEKRQAVIKQTCDWWSPERSRLPEHMLRPKIITPHLILLPKFSLDAQGKYGISRSPLMYLKETQGGIDLFYYFLAVLNSSTIYWQIASLSHKYKSGYFMLEAKTLKKLCVPDPANVSPSTMKEIQRLVQQRVKNENSRIDERIDIIIAELYELSHDDRKEIGMAGYDDLSTDQNQ